jgi:hypothetical protein
METNDTPNDRAADNKMPVEQWLAIRREAALLIDPETAEVSWIFAEVGDPYGVYPKPPEGYSCIGRSYFARSPGSEVWVSFYDLPEATNKALWKRLAR